MKTTQQLKMQTIDRNYDYFVSIRDDLVKKYPNDFVVINDEEVKQEFNEEATAYRYGIENFGLGNFIIQHCVPEEEEINKFHSRVSFSNA